MGFGAQMWQAFLMSEHLHAIEDSLTLVASRIGDPAGLVYAALFARHPAMEAEFWRDRSGAIRGEMLARMFETVLDLAGPRAYADAVIGTEAVTHDAYGIPRTVFLDFFEVVAGVVRDVCAADFTPAMAAAWAAVASDAAAILAALPGPDAPQRALDPALVLPAGGEGVAFPGR
jgi:hemoglobin-like flavoprotein